MRSSVSHISIVISAGRLPPRSEIRRPRANAAVFSRDTYSRGYRWLDSAVPRSTRLRIVIPTESASCADRHGVGRGPRNRLVKGRYQSKHPQSEICAAATPSPCHLKPFARFSGHTANCRTSSSTTPTAHCPSCARQCVRIESSVEEISPSGECSATARKAKSGSCSVRIAASSLVQFIAALGADHDHRNALCKGHISQ